MKRASLVWNPVAGGQPEDLDAVRELLAAHFDLEVLETSPERDADACAREALARHPDLVIAAGGDGTVSLVASALVGGEVPLGIIPRGTSSSIASGLGISDDVSAAVQTLVSGEAIRLDTAVANGRTMVLHASVGVHAAAVGGTDRDDKDRLGVLAYVMEGLAAFRETEPFALELETETEVVRCRAINVTVANVAPRKTLLAQGPAVISPSDGALDVTIVAAADLAEAVATGLHLLKSAALGEAVTRDNVGYLCARRIRITTDPPQPVLVDGEPIGEGQLVVEVVPRSVIVMVPTPPPQKQDAEQKLDGLPELEVERATS